MSLDDQHASENADGTWLLLKTPVYAIDPTAPRVSYLRIGAPNSADETGYLDSLHGAEGVQNKDDLRDKSTPPKTYPGWFEYTDGDRTRVVRGDNRQSVGGDERTTIGGDKFDKICGQYTVTVGSGKSGGEIAVTNADRENDPIYHKEFFPTQVQAGGADSWRKREFMHGSSDSYTFGDDESFFGGYKFEATFGMTNEIFAGGKLDVSIAASLSVDLGFAIELGASMKYANVVGKDLNVVGDQETKARKSIHLRIKPESSAGPAYENKIILGLVGTAATVIAAGASTQGTVDADGFALTPAIGLGVAAGVFAAGLAASLFLALKEKRDAVVPRSSTELKLEKKHAVIAINDHTGTTPKAELRMYDHGAGPVIGLVNFGGTPEVRSLDTVKGYVVLDNKRNLNAGCGNELTLKAGTGSKVTLGNDGKVEATAKRFNVKASYIDLGGHLIVLP